MQKLITIRTYAVLPIVFGQDESEVMSCKGTSMMHCFHLYGVSKGMCWTRATAISKRIKSIAPPITELCLSEVICK